MRKIFLFLLLWASLGWSAMQVHVESREEGSIGGNNSQVRLLLVNTGTEVLDQATLYYWFTPSTGKTPDFQASSVPNGQVSLENLGSGQYRMKVVLTGINLAAGQSLNWGNGIQVTLYNTDWSAWNLSDDYSYMGPPWGLFQLNSKVQVISAQGLVLWGVAPGSGQSSSVATSSSSFAGTTEIFYDGQSNLNASFEPSTAWPDGVEVVANHGQYDGYGNIDMYAIRTSGARAYESDWTASYKLPGPRNFTGASFAFDILVINDNTVGAYTPRWGFRLQDITGRTSEPLWFNFSFKQGTAIRLPASSFTLPAGFNLSYVTHIVMEIPGVPAQQHITVFFDNLRLEGGSIPLSSQAQSSSTPISSSTLSSSTTTMSSSSLSMSSSSQTGSLSVTVQGMGIAIPSGVLPAATGMPVDVSLRANTGFSLQSLWLDNAKVAIPSDGLYHFIGDGKDHTLLAEFTQSYGEMRLLRVSLGDNGYASLVGVHLVPRGSSYVIQFYPKDGYRVKAVTLNSVAQGALSQISVSSIQSEVHVHVDFELETNGALELVAHGAGTVKLALVQDERKPYRVHAVAEAGAVLRDVQVNGVSVGVTPAVEVARGAAGGRVEAWFDAAPSTASCPVTVESSHQTPDVLARPVVHITGKGAALAPGWYWDYYVQLAPGNQLSVSPWYFASMAYQSQRLAGDLWRIRVTGQGNLTPGLMLEAKWGMQFSSQYSWYKSAELSATPQYDATLRTNELIPVYDNAGLLLCGAVPNLEKASSPYQLQVFHKDDGCSQEYIRPRILIKNIGTEPLSDFSYLYVFKILDGRVPQLDGDWYTPEAQVSLLDKGEGEYALRFDFTGTTLHPGQSISTGGATAGVHLLGWEAVNHNDDRSFQQSACGGTMVLNEKIPVYDRRGIQVYGTPYDPDGSNSGTGDVQFLSGPNDMTVVQGQDARFDVQVQGTVNFTLQWMRNGAVIPGATGTSYTEPKVSLHMDGNTYQVVAWVKGQKIASRVAKLTVTVKNMTPVFDVQPKDAMMRAGMGQTAEFVVHAIDPMGGSIRYQWYVNGSLVPGATNTQLTLDAPDGALVYAVATGLGGTAKSRTVGLRVLPFVPPSERVSIVGHLVSKAYPQGVGADKPLRVPMTVKLYDQRKGGVALYTEQFRAPAMQPYVDKGQFTLQLGTGDASGSLTTLTRQRTTLYAEIRFGNGTIQELAPDRISFTAVPYTQGVTP